MDANPPRTFHDLVRGARRWWYIVAAAALVGLVFGLFATQSGSRSRSEATVRLFDNRDLATSVGLGPAYIANVTPSRVAADVRSQLDQLAPDAKGISFGLVPDDVAFTIDVVARASTITEAEAAAGELAAAIVTHVQANVDARAATLSDFHAERLASVESELGAAPDDMQRSLLLVQRNSHLEALSALTTISRGPAAEVDPLTADASSTISTRQTYGAAGLVGGSFVGLLIVYVLVVNDRRIRRGADLEGATGHPTLAVMTDDAMSSQTTAVIALASALQRRFGSGRSVTVVGIGAAERAAAVAAAVTDALATLVSDPDQRTTVVAASNDGSGGLSIEAALATSGTLIVVRADRTTIDEARATISTLETAGITIAGTVVTGVRPSDAAWVMAPAAPRTPSS